MTAMREKTNLGSAQNRIFGGNKRIIHQVTRSYMKKNKGRTVISMLGILLMVALMTCVFVGKDTMIGYLEDIGGANDGKWHFSFYNIDREQFSRIEAQEFVKQTAMSEDLHYSAFERSGNELRPYLNVKRYSDNAFDWQNIEVTQGRLPEKENEIVISEEVLTDGGKLSVGDTIETDCFRRYIENTGEGVTVFPFLDFSLESGETKEAPADFGYFLEGDEFYLDHREIHENTGERENYTVTGFIRTPYFENEGSCAYTAISWMDSAIAPETTFNCSIVTDADKLPEDSRGYFKTLLGDVEMEVNNSVLAFSGNSTDSTVNVLVRMVQSFFLILIVLAAVILIYNMFNLSFDERCRYLGMLTSVGATSAQKMSSIYYEAWMLLLPAIPAGLLTGFGIVYLGGSLLKPFAVQFMSIYMAIGIPVLRLRVTLPALLWTVGFSVFTVLIASLLPARKIRKIGPVESIRGNQEKTMRGRKSRQRSRWLIRHFGAEGMLAARFAGGQRRKSRGIVRSLSVFLTVLVVTVYGARVLSQMTDYKLSGENDIRIVGPEDYDYILVAGTEEVPAAKSILRELSEMKGISDMRICYTDRWAGQAAAPVMSQEYWESLYDIIRCFYPEGLTLQEFQEQYKEGKLEFVNMISIDADTFREMRKAVSTEDTIEADYPCIVFQGGQMSTNTQIVGGRNADGFRFRQIHRMTDLAVGEEIPLELWDVGRTVLPLTIVGFGDNDTLGKWLNIQSDTLWVITEQSAAEMVEDICGEEGAGLELTAWFRVDETDSQVAAKLQQLKNLSGVDDELFYLATPETFWPSTFRDAINNMLRILMVGFVIVCSLICFLNIYNTVTGLMYTRRREFAILRSGGMTDSQLLRMCQYELTVLAIKSMSIAIPVSAVLCCFINHVMIGRFGYFTVDFPILPVALIVLTALAAVLAVAGVCCVRQGKTNLMEEIRRESI